MTQPTTRPDQDLSGNPKRGGDLKVSCPLKPCKCQSYSILVMQHLPGGLLSGRGSTHTLLGSTSWPLPVARQELFSKVRPMRCRTPPPGSRRCSRASAMRGRPARRAPLPAAAPTRPRVGTRFFCVVMLVCHLFASRPATVLAAIGHLCMLPWGLVSIFTLLCHHASSACVAEALLPHTDRCSELNNTLPLVVVQA